MKFFRTCPGIVYTDELYSLPQTRNNRSFVYPFYNLKWRDTRCNFISLQFEGKALLLARSETDKKKRHYLYYCVLFETALQLITTFPEVIEIAQVTSF